jgi:hypothetical protein
VAFAVLNEVLNDTWSSCVQVIAANEVGWKFMLGLPRAVLPVSDGIGCAVDDGRHDAGLGGDHANTKTLSEYDTRYASDGKVWIQKKS